jgi:hypothetical protein
MKVILRKSPKPTKKFRVIFPDGKYVDFGGKGYSDYTKHGNPYRMRLYIKRHSKLKENWSKKGIKTAGFWSRWLLWSRPSMNEAKRLLSSRFDLTFA